MLVGVVKFTLPVGIALIVTPPPRAALFSVTVARNVTACPAVDGLGKDVNVVIVGTLLPPNRDLAAIRAMAKRVESFRFKSASLPVSSCV